MLFAPPPGYNPAAMNHQSVSSYTVPGQQGQAALGFYSPKYFGSSYSTPSSFAISSEIPYPQPYYGPPNSQVANMAKALRG